MAPNGSEGGAGGANSGSAAASSIAASQALVACPVVQEEPVDPPVEQVVLTMSAAFFDKGIGGITGGAGGAGC